MSVCMSTLRISRLLKLSGWKRPDGECVFSWAERRATYAGVRARLVEPGVWEGELAVPEDARGELELRVTAHDVAGNRGETTVTLPVAARAEDPARVARSEAQVDATGLGEGAP